MQYSIKVFWARGAGPGADLSASCSASGRAGPGAHRTVDVLTLVYRTHDPRMLPYERPPPSTREVLPSRVTCHSPHQGVAMPSVAQAAPQHSCLRRPRLKAGCVRGVQRSATVFAGSTHNREARRQRQLAQLLIVRSGSRCPAPTRWQCGVAMAGAYEVEGCACAWVAAATQACGVVECAWRAEVSCRAQASRSLCPHTPRQDHTKRCHRPLHRVAAARGLRRRRK